MKLISVNKKKIIDNVIKNKYIIILYISIFIFIIFFLTFISSNLKLNSKVYHLIDELEGMKTNIDAIQQSFMLSVKNSNEVRKYLGLSEESYPFGQFQDKEKMDESSKDLLAFFKGLDKIYNHNIREKNLESFARFKNGDEFYSFKKKFNFKIVENDEYRLLLIKNNTPYFDIVYKPENEKINISTFTNSNIDDVYFDDKTIQILKIHVEKINDHLKNINLKLASLLNIITEKNISDILKQRKLIFSEMQETSYAYEIWIKNNKEEFIKIGISKVDGLMFIDDNTYYNEDDFLENLYLNITNLDMRDQKQKNIDNAQSKILDILQDEGFKTLLLSKKLQIANKTRKDDYFIYYDVVGEQGEKFGSFAIDKMHGKYYIVDKDEIQISSLNSLLEEENIKKN